MKNILINGGPGTGKTIISRAMTYYIGHEGLDVEQIYTKDFYADIDSIETYIESEFVEYIQIHPSMTYEDIVYGIDLVSNQNLSIQYTEKRIKKLCDRAIGRREKFFIVLDDIGRANAGSLLGDLLYAMEYRNQSVVLPDGNSLVIPDNVIIIITECRTLYGTPLEYAIRRRFDYQKELFSESVVLDRYYSNCLPQGTKNIVLNSFETIRNFVCNNILNDSSIQKDNYIPGHGMLMVDRTGSANDIIARISQKIDYQLMPYLMDMSSAGIIICNSDDLENLHNSIKTQLNAGTVTVVNNSQVEKVFCNSLRSVPTFSLDDSKNYYSNTIIPNGCREHRTIIENIVDAIFTNGIFSVDKALSDILLNTDVVRFENRNVAGVYSAFLVELSQNNNFGYLTTNSNNVRSYYSSNACKTGRWQAFNDAPAYKVDFQNGSTKTYISLNAFRNSGFDTSLRVIHAQENTASIYCALYKLVDTYLNAYETSLSMSIANDVSLNALYKLVSFEKRYWELKNIEATSLTGSDNKLKKLGEAVLNLKTLWTQAGLTVDVDDVKFNSLVNGTLQVSVQTYENLYNITGHRKSIEIKGVDTMVDLNNYQHIMENIGVHQMIFQGPPGTSKTFESKKFVLEQLNPASPVFNSDCATQEDISLALDSFKLSADDYENPQSSSKLVTGGWDLVQFHPSYGYEDFIRGIEVKPAQQGGISYASVNRILGKIAELSQIAEKTATEQGNDAPKFYLIVDEINRANLATVFGELIYGLEYRNSKVSTPYEVEDRVTDPASITKDIVLGKNLFIIGTMNTADKSIDSIDYAIRRRFIFVDSPAKREVVVNCYQNKMNVTDENSIEVLLFDAVSNLFDGNRFFNDEYQRNDVKIGHTYFLRSVSDNYADVMAEKFVFQVIPILKEYVKDGIIDSFEDLIQHEHSCEEIAAAEGNERVSLLAENIMLYVKHFGENNENGERIDNAYVARFIESLCDQLGW